MISLYKESSNLADAMIIIHNLEKNILKVLIYNNQWRFGNGFGSAKNNIEGRMDGSTLNNF